jgi:hypothetical protein
VSNKSTSPPRDPGERKESLRPSDMASGETDPSAPFDARGLRQYEPPGTREDRLTLTTPVYARRGLETLATGERMPIQHVALFALHRGLRRLSSWPEVQTICDTRALLLQRGSDDIEQLDGWAYYIAARHGGQRRLDLRAVDPADAGQCQRIAQGLGLPTSTLGALAIIAGIVDAPLPGDVPDYLCAELTELRAGLRKRAAICSDLRERAARMPQSPQRQVRWEDIQ